MRKSKPPKVRLSDTFRFERGHEIEVSGLRLKNTGNEEVWTRQVSTRPYQRPGLRLGVCSFPLGDFHYVVGRVDRDQGQGRRIPGEDDVGVFVADDDYDRPEDAEA